MAVRAMKQHSVQIDPHVLRREANHADALLAQPNRPPPIMLPPIRMIMALPIDLDRQLRFGAVEVEHERPDRMLATEFQAA